MKLYHYPLSGHSHRVRLFLSLVGVEAELIEVDLKSGEHKRAEFLVMNIFGQVPVLADEGVIVSDSNAILVYLARKLGRNDWLPDEAQGAAAVQRWLSVAAGELAFGPAAARLVTLFGASRNVEEVLGRAHALLAVVEAHLSTRDWLAVERPTIADVALYSYIAYAPEGNVDLSIYANLKAWLQRVEALPGFLPLSRSPVGLQAAA
jgi:glutathione S-transferase